MNKLVYCFAVLFPFTTSAQLHLFSLNNDVKSTLAKVIEDFPDHFDNIREDLIDRDVQSLTYKCSANIPGADSSIIIQNGDLKDNIYSWKEVVFKSADFDVAKSRFREYYRRIKGSNASVGDNKITFDADYNEPDVTKQFVTVLFIAHPQTEELKNVVIDLSLHYLMVDWEISISVYEHTEYGVDDKESK